MMFIKIKVISKFLNFKNETRPRDIKEKKLRDTIYYWKHTCTLWSTKVVLNAFRSGIFLLQPTEGTNHWGVIARVAKISDLLSLKILTPKVIPQRLPMTLAQVKPSNTSEKLLNKIRQIIYSLYEVNKITKKVFNNIMSSINLYYKMDNIFMNSYNSKTSDPHRLLPNLWDKTNLKRSDESVDLSNLSIYYTGKNIKSFTKTKHLKYRVGQKFRSSITKIKGKFWQKTFLHIIL